MIMIKKAPLNIGRLEISRSIIVKWCFPWQSLFSKPSIPPPFSVFFQVIPLPIPSDSPNSSRRPHRAGSSIFLVLYSIKNSVKMTIITTGVMTVLDATLRDERNSMTFAAIFRGKKTLGRIVTWVHLLGELNVQDKWTIL